MGKSELPNSGAVPYEHAYHLDYGAAAAKYVDAFMRNVDWDQVRQRLFDATAPRQGSYRMWDTTWNPG